MLYNNIHRRDLYLLCNFISRREYHMDLEFKDLEYLCALAQHKSITRASEALFITQPTLSQYLKNLQQRLGMTLYLVNGRHIQLTPEGEVLVQEGKNCSDNGKNCPLWSTVSIKPDMVCSIWQFQWDGAAISSPPVFHPFTGGIQRQKST